MRGAAAFADLRILSRVSASVLVMFALRERRMGEVIFFGGGQWTVDSRQVVWCSSVLLFFWSCVFLGIFFDF